MLFIGEGIFWAGKKGFHYKREDVFQLLSQGVWYERFWRNVSFRKKERFSKRRNNIFMKEDDLIVLSVLSFPATEVSIAQNAK